SGAAQLRRGSGRPERRAAARHPGGGAPPGGLFPHPGGKRRAGSLTPMDGSGGGGELRRFRRLADLTALVTLLLIIVGGVVRVSGCGLGCGPGGSGPKGWPLCGGSVIPLVGDENRIIEFSHRLLATVVVVLIILLCWRAYRGLRDRRWAVRGSVAAGVLVLAQ